MNRPFKAVDREYLAQVVAQGRNTHPKNVGELLSAEAYWRETVKDSEPVEYYGINDDRRCYWCARDFYGDVGHAECKDPEKHEPDCPWILAQEPKA